MKYIASVAFAFVRWSAGASFAFISNLNAERSHKRETPPGYARQFEMATVKSATSQ